MGECKLRRKERKGKTRNLVFKMRSDMAREIGTKRVISKEEKMSGRRSEEGYFQSNEKAPRQQISFR
jgi:hypothetical protein